LKITGKWLRMWISWKKKNQRLFMDLKASHKTKQKFSVNVLVFKELRNSSLRFEGIEIAVPLKELQWQFLHCCICCNWNPEEHGACALCW
jgi:hypothetical protein